MTTVRPEPLPDDLLMPPAPLSPPSVADLLEPLPQASPPSPRHPRWPWLVGGVAAAAVIVGALWILRRRRQWRTPLVRSPTPSTGIGAVEFTGVTTSERYELGTSGTTIAAERAEDHLVIVSASVAGPDIEMSTNARNAWMDELMAWARDIEITHSDPDVMAAHTATVTSTRSTTGSSDYGVTWVFQAPEGPVGDLAVDLGEGRLVDLGGLPEGSAD
jgi:hypothetical protein